MKKIILALVCAASALPARVCAGTGNRPDWVDGSSMEYPREKYLVGISQADDLLSAKDRARGEISRIFSTQVTINTNVTASEQTASRGGKTTSSFSQDVLQNVRAASQKMLEGVEITETWQDPATRQYYALAVLDRANALKAVTEKLSELDGRARDLGVELSSVTEKFSRVKTAMKLLALLKGREGLVSDMRVLDPGRKTAPLFDVNRARKDAARAVAGLDVSVVMSGEEAPQVAAAIVKTLNGLGIEAKAGRSGGADIEVECAVESVEVKDADTQSRWKFSRYSAVVALKDAKTDKTFLSFDSSAKEASADLGEARLKAKVSLGKKIGAGINEGITAYFENQ